MTRKEIRAQVAEFIRHSPLSYRLIALKLGCSRSTINNITREFGISRQEQFLSEGDLAKLVGVADEN